MRLPEIELSGVSTPLGHCISLTDGHVDSTTLSRLEEGQFDQAPLIGESGEVIGIVDTGLARRLHDEGLPITLGHAHATQLASRVRIDELFRTLGRTRAALVSGGSAPAALVTISDLNRHEALLGLYEPLAQFEIALARFLEGRVAFEDWLRVLPEHAQAEILGYWELSRRKNVDIGPMARCTLTHLITIAAKLPEIHTALGFPSKTQAEKALNGLPDLRNGVMHPVRPLVLQPQDALDISDKLQRIAEIGPRLQLAADR